MDKEQRLEQHIETIARLIIECKHIVAFTGAGISTDSGIPDFRGPGGVWTRRDAGLPAPQWRVPPGQVKPNASHLALFELQRLHKLQFLITQNTDNLHRQSGIRPELLAELHGNGQLLRCLGCDRLYTQTGSGVGYTPVGAGLSYSETGCGAASLSWMWWPANLVCGELWRSAAP